MAGYDGARLTSGSRISCKQCCSHPSQQCGRQRLVTWPRLETRSTNTRGGTTNQASTNLHLHKLTELIRDNRRNSEAPSWLSQRRMAQDAECWLTSQAACDFRSQISWIQ